MINATGSFEESGCSAKGSLLCQMRVAGMSEQREKDEKVPGGLEPPLQKVAPWTLDIMESV